MIKTLSTKAQWLRVNLRTNKSFVSALGLVLFVAASLLAAPLANAGEEYDKGKHKGKWKQHSKQEELKHEVSYLAQKLLDISGEEMLTVTQEPYKKPFLGVCSAVSPGGVQLTCITPGHAAEAAGLRTGDMVVEIDGISMLSPKTENVKKVYYDKLGAMKKGQILTIKVFRGSEEKTIKATVGEFSQPGYTLTIRRK